MLITGVACGNELGKTNAINRKYKKLQNDKISVFCAQMLLSQWQ